MLVPVGLNVWSRLVESLFPYLDQRVGAKAHWLADVIGGLLEDTAYVMFAIVAFEQWGRPRPRACPGQLALSAGMTMDRSLTVRVFSRRLVALLVLTALLAVVSLASASPPDSIWEPGLYDDADFDDVVVTLVTLNGLPEPLFIRLYWDQGVVETLAPIEPHRTDRATLRSFQSRAPPSR